MLSEADRAWFRVHAESLDVSRALAPEVLPRLAQAGLLQLGVPRELGGDGGATWNAVEAISAVAEESLAAAFAFWGHRVFIECLLQTPNAALRERRLAPLLAGTQAGATGLSNAMKFLGGIESLNLHATARDGQDANPTGWQLNGRVPWCTNLHPRGFIAAVAVARDAGAPFVAALDSSLPGLVRSDDLDLIALRGSHTAALSLQAVPVDQTLVLHADANVFLPQLRPAFLALQCGLAIGLARASLGAAAQRSDAGRDVLNTPLQTQSDALDATAGALRQGLRDGRFRTDAPALFRLRLALVDIVQQALQLELNATGGRAYHRDQPGGFARRWLESAFIPIVTPSVTQLRGALAKHDAQSPVARTRAALEAGTA